MSLLVRRPQELYRVYNEFEYMSGAPGAECLVPETSEATRRRGGAAAVAAALLVFFSSGSFLGPKIGIAKPFPDVQGVPGSSALGSGVAGLVVHALGVKSENTRCASGFSGPVASNGTAVNGKCSPPNG